MAAGGSARRATIAAAAVAIGRAERTAATPTSDRVAQAASAAAGTVIPAVAATTAALAVAAAAATLAVTAVSAAVEVAVCPGWRKPGSAAVVVLDKMEGVVRALAVRSSSSRAAL